MQVSRRLAFLYLATICVGIALARPAAATCSACSCSATANGVAFGAYVPTDSAPNTANGSVRITCSSTSLNNQSLSYAIQLTAGSGTYAQRVMKAGTATLNYNIYTTSGGPTVWGDGTSSTQTVSDSFTLTTLGSIKSYPMYGIMPARQAVASGNFTDSIMVTIVY